MITPIYFYVQAYQLCRIDCVLTHANTCFFSEVIACKYGVIPSLNYHVREKATPYCCAFPLMRSGCSLCEEINTYVFVSLIPYEIQSMSLMYMYLSRGFHQLSSQYSFEYELHTLAVYMSENSDTLCIIAIMQSHILYPFMYILY